MLPKKIGLLSTISNFISVLTSSAKKKLIFIFFFDLRTQDFAGLVSAVIFRDITISDLGGGVLKG